MKRDLTGLHVVTARGKTYVYAWRGGPRLTAERGSDEFLEQLLEARRGARSGERGKLSGLCADYRARPWWANAGETGCIAKSTKRNWSRWLDEIQDHFGKLSIGAFDRPKIVKAIRVWRDKYRATPRAADMALQVLSHLLSFAAEEGQLTSNPCARVPHLYRVDRSEIIWTDDDLAGLKKVASGEIWRAAQLAALTGLRQADLLKLAWGHVGEMAIEIPTGKSGGRKTTLIPLYAELQAALAAIPKRGPIVLTNTDGRPWKSGFGSSWNKAIAKADIEGKHFHDLRGTAATRLYVALRRGDVSDRQAKREIAEIMTWSEAQVERLIDRYVNRDELLKDRIRRLDANA